MDKFKSFRNPDHNDQDDKSSFKKLILFTASFVLILILVQGGINFVEADTPTSISVKVDYTDETVTVPSTASQSQKFYMSIDNKKTWELIDSSKSIDNKVDISGLLSSRAVTIYFKGNKDTLPTPLVLQADDSSLKPIYKVINVSGQYKGMVEFVASPANREVQYRKGPNGMWTKVTSPMDTSMFEIKGASLYFRMAPTVDLRASKVVTLRIPKRPNAPNVRLDGSKLCLTGLKAGETQYRVGDDTNWTTFTSDTKANFINLLSLKGVSLTASGNLPKITVELRTPATDKKVTSGARVVEIPEQPILSASTVKIDRSTISVIDTDLSKYYEYTIPDTTMPFDLSKARWISFTAKKPVIIKTNIHIGSIIYVRMKSATNRETKQIIPASTYVPVTVNGIS